MARSVRSFTLSLETQTQLDQLQSDLEPHNLTPLLTAEPSLLPPPSSAPTKNKKGLVSWEETFKINQQAALKVVTPIMKMNASRLVDILLTTAINLVREREARRAEMQRPTTKPPRKAA